MTADEQKKLAELFVYKGEENDFQFIEDNTTDDFTLETMEVDAEWQLGDVTVPGVMSKEQYLKYGMPAMKQLFKNGMEFTCELVISDGPHVAILGRSKAVATNGKPYNNVYVWYLKFRGDKICEMREYRDTHHSRVVLGF